MSCDIIIAVWNLKELTQRCIESIINNTEYLYRLIVIDNGSEQETKDYLEGLKSDHRLKEYILIRNEVNLGATKAYNQGMRISMSDNVLLLNNDTIVCKGWLTEMIHILEKSNDIGIVNPASNNLGQRRPKNMTLQEFAAKRLNCFSGQYVEMATAVGFCYLVKREVLNKVGFWNEGYGLGNFEETEHCIKTRQAGYRVMLAKGAYVYHEEGASFKKVSTYESAFSDNKKKFESFFGKPERILYIFTKSNRKLFYSLRQQTYDLANKRNWITVFKKSSAGDVSFAEHTNIKIFSFSGIIFKARCIYKIFVKKKKFNEIYVDDDKLFNFLRKFRGFLKAEIRMFSSDAAENLKVLDVGCGRAKGKGTIGVDMEPHQDVDVVCDLNKYPWPFESNTFDFLYCISVIEHLDNVVKTMDELHRIGKNGSVIIVDTSHFAHPNSYRDPTHKWHFTLGTFDYFTGEVLYPRYSKLKFKMLKKELRFRKKYCTGKIYAFFSARRYEKYYCHRCPPYSIYFEIEIVKD